MKSPDNRILTEAEVVGVRGRVFKKVIVTFPGMSSGQRVEVPKGRFAGSDIKHLRVGDRFVTEVNRNAKLARDIKPSKIARVVHP